MDSSLQKHELLLVASSRVPVEDIVETNNICSGIFSKITSIKVTIGTEGHWPKAPNDIFRAAYEWVKKNRKSYYLWLEPDCAPLVPYWLDILEEEYRSKGKPLMGFVYDKPFRHMNGVAIWNVGFPGFNPQVLGAQNLPFDCVRPELNLRQCHSTQLIWRQLSDPVKNLSLTFPTQESLSVIPSGAVLTHCCKDQTIVDRLMERNGNNNSVAVKPVPMHKPSLFRRGIQALTKTKNKTTYYHSGNMGDIIYALYAIKLAGGGDLIIGPNQRGTSPCSVPISQSQYNLLEPLLKVQPYIRTVRYSTDYPRCDHDLNRFRTMWFDLDLRIETRITTLCQMHCHLLNVGNKFSHTQPWLALPDKVPPNNKVIIARSLRHRNWDLNYATVIRNCDCQFIGHQQEHMIFELAWPKIEYRPVRDFLDMAQVIAGSNGMAGNQSFPMALALALGKPVLQEVFWHTPDCVFDRDNFFRQGQEQQFLKCSTIT